MKKKEQYLKIRLRELKELSRKYKRERKNRIEKENKYLFVQNKCLRIPIINSTNGNTNWKMRLREKIRIREY